MKLWDLNSELIFPPTTVAAYVKNILWFAGSDMTVTAHLSTRVTHHCLQGVTRDGLRVELYAPYFKRDAATMFIPFILQKSLSGGDLQWSTDGRNSSGCFRIAKQDEETEIRMISSRSAFLRYAHSGKPPTERSALAAYPRERKAYIENEMARGIMRETFMFVGNDGRERVVPFIPTVLNSSDKLENANVPPRSLAPSNRLAIAGY